MNESLEESQTEDCVRLSVLLPVMTRGEEMW